MGGAHSRVREDVGDIVNGCTGYAGFPTGMPTGKPAYPPVHYNI